MADNRGTGRLKLRKSAPDRGELIAYDPPNTLGQKPSHYKRVPTRSPDAMRVVLEAALGTCARVRKPRLLYLIDTAHLIDVAYVDMLTLERGEVRGRHS